MSHGLIQPLLTPVCMGDLELRNRVVIAPLTRTRADNPAHAPIELHARYYAQRASADLIVWECTAIGPAVWRVEPGRRRGSVPARLRRPVVEARR